MSIAARFRLTRAGFTLDVDLSLPAHGVTALFGASGSGKTTLLRCIAGLERAPGGKLCIGDDCWQDGARFLPTYRRPLGYVSQDAALFPHLSVSGNLDYGCARVPLAERRIPIGQAVELLGIGHLLHRWPDGLSGGERQRVAIARALATSPRLLLMDEPLAALDERRKAEFLPWLEKLHDELEIPVLYVSHALPEVARLADHLVLLEAGRTLADGPLAELLPRLDLPLSHGDEAFVVIAATVGDYDADYALARLDFAGQSLLAPSTPRPKDSLVRVRIQARDVSLAKSPQHDSSILNTLSARIVGLEEQAPGRVLARLDVSGTALLARLTKKSADLLQLAVGESIYAQLKSVALLD